jgi:hypothetical protein
LRVVIWDAFDVPCKDVEETSDIYVTAYLDENDKQKTDTHYRSFNGRVILMVSYVRAPLTGG